MPATTTTVKIFVELDKKTRVKVEFETNRVTGLQIKDAAGIPPENDLARRHGHKLDLVTNEQEITIENGDRFVSLPPGTIS